MIFGDPHRFAIWVEYVPQWSDSYRNGLFCLIINGNMYPDNIRVSTLSVDLYEIIDNDCALVSQPKNESIFGLSKKDAFNRLFKLVYPEPSEEDEYPEQDFDYCVMSSNVSDSGCCFFVVADEYLVRIIGGKTEQLVESEDGNYWEHIEQPIIEDVILSKDEINKIINDVRDYSLTTLKQ
ncbi:immunity 42 family protein [Arsenophonus apicola]|uniref:immunity 42 family protein n=1 Tax=Arsenophonus apicola TaxID=2879119 RepID=UPI00387994DF